MCGILYSQDSKGFTDLEMLKRRGPEAFVENKHSLGYFAHSMLNTIGQNTPQPYHTKSGILLFKFTTPQLGAKEIIFFEVNPSPKYIGSEPKKLHS